MCPCAPAIRKIHAIPASLVLADLSRIHLRQRQNRQWATLPLQNRDGAIRGGLRGDTPANCKQNTVDMTRDQAGIRYGKHRWRIHYDHIEHLTHGIEKRKQPIWTQQLKRVTYHLAGWQKRQRTRYHLDERLFQRSRSGKDLAEAGGRIDVEDKVRGRPAKVCIDEQAGSVRERERLCQG